MSNKKHKLSYEILGIVGICTLVAVLLFLTLSNLTLGLIEEYLFHNDIIITDDEYFNLDRTIVSGSLIISLIVFILLFILLFKNKLIYIKELMNIINELSKGNYDVNIKIKGNNELSDLAKSINYLFKSEKEIKEKEEKLKKEKEELIRNLSHDLRTPLTSIISYSELELNKNNIDKEYPSLVLKKAKQIKDITDILLDSKRNVLFYEDGKLLIYQLVEDFKLELEDDYNLNINLDNLKDFTLNIDINELIRIFDNLISNIKKYSDKDVNLIISNDNGLLIKQFNNIKKISNEVEHNNIGLNSIKRIAQNYEGSVNVIKDNNYFEINIFLNL